MLSVRPTKDSPIYVEWKKWVYQRQKELDQCKPHNYALADQAVQSIERIAEFVYEGQNSCIVGTMTMMKYTEEMEAENCNHTNVEGESRDGIMLWTKCLDCGKDSRNKP